MFRVSQFMQEIANPAPLGEKRHPPGPVVIWNLIRRCNLACKHCYSISADTDFPGELTTEEVFTVMDDLKAFRVPVLILSGGEPLLRPDIFDISRRAKSMGFYVGLSTNGTLIDERMIGRIADIGYDYVGISIDGLRETHDRFRRLPGAFDASLHGMRLCRDAGIKVGMRFTMTQDNAAELPALLDLMATEGIEKFYFSHLNYAGRGNINRQDDALLKTTRWAMDLLFERSWDYTRRGIRREFVTGNNDADGVYLLFWVRKHFADRIEATTCASLHSGPRLHPEVEAGAAGQEWPVGGLPQLEDHLRRVLARWGGNSSGVNIANIDNLGNVHPDTMWWHYTLGNVKDRPFGEIWNDTSDPLMAGLKASPRTVHGRCGSCRYFDICGGNTRVRAHQLTGDPWAEDPACYLTDEEIGVVPGTSRVTVTPYSRRQSAGG